MEIYLKNAMLLSAIMFFAVMMFSIAINISGTEKQCRDFSVTGFVTDSANTECSDFFRGLMLNSSLWSLLWSVVCLFIFIIVIQVLPGKKDSSN